MNKEHIISHLDFKSFYQSHVINLKENGKAEANGLCPFHDDHNPSLSVNLKDGLWKCHAGCGGGNSISFLMKLKGIGSKQAWKELEGIAGGPERGDRKIKAVYDYRDEKGILLYQAVRYEPKDFRPRRKGQDGKWIYGLDGVRRVLYNLPEIVKANHIIIVEGEKDVDNLKTTGFTGDMTVTTSQGGSEGWRTEYADYLKGKTVVIVPDNDKPGWKYAETVAKSLQGKASVIKIITLPSLGEIKEKHGLDISVWIELRRKEGKTDNEIKSELLGLVENTPEWTPAPEAEKKEPDLLSSLESWQHIQSLDIKVEWIVDRVIPKESISLVFGKGGIGKTWLTLDMARCIGSGIPYLGLSTIKAPVIFIDFENPLAVLNTRTQKLGDCQNVYFWRANNEKVKPPRLDSNEWELYKQLPKGAVLIFDTLRASHGKDENASNDMGLIMGRLKELRDMGFTIILLHHTAKNSDKVAKGSTAIVDLADHILGLTLVKKKQSGQDVVIEDDEDTEDEAVYKFGVREKTRFEPYHIYLTLNPDRGFELAPDPQEDVLKRMHGILTEHGTITKTVFKESCKGLGLGEKKLRKMIEIGQGRYWDIEKRPDQKNAQFVTPKIQSGSLSALYSSARLPDCSDTPKNSPTRLSETDSHKTLANIESGSLSEGVCQTAKLNLREGVL